jgi:tRNA-specific 2-thiouridylase
LTPNPCVICNQEIKFESLLYYADRNGILHIATGHYARLEKNKISSFTELYRGKDGRKEQSYFLHRLNQRVLSRAVFPLGDTRKSENRIQAKKMGLPVGSAHESQEICFLSGKDYRFFIEAHRHDILGGRGDIVNTRGEILGRHSGAYRYTIGQRQGLGIASSQPYYVKRIRPETNQVVVARREALFSKSVEAERFHWIGATPSEAQMEARAQIRYRHKPAAGVLNILPSDRVRFVFHEAQWAVTPGQAIVCYGGDRVLGGGWIR